MYRIFLNLFFLLQFSAAFGQEQKFTISGYAKEDATGEFLIGASVTLREPFKGTTTNAYGFYSLTVAKGEYDMVISYLGMEEFKQHIVLDKDQRINVSLKVKAVEIKEVEITGDRTDVNVKDAQMSSAKLDIEQIKEIPQFMGEVDVLKTIQLLPGVKGAGDGNSGFYVRGGGPDQNLILLDEAVVYNAAHLFGFFSVFNGDAVKGLNLIKGGMPAQYGGRLSSVLDITMKEGNSKEYDVEGGLGVISSRLTVQGPIKKDTSSFILSGRRTYIDVLMEPFVKDTSPFKGSGYYFYDLNTKLNYRISDKDRLFMSGYFGRDVFSYNNKDDDFTVRIPWGNATGSLRWNHLFNQKLFMNSTLVFSDYKFEFQAGQEGFEFKLFSGIRDFNGKVDFSWYPNYKHNVKYGANYTFHIFTPNNVSAKAGEVEFDLGGLKKQYAHEAGVYINDEWDLNERWRISPGFRVSYFMQVGPFDRYIKDVTGRTTDTISYGRNEKVKDYLGLEPRFSVRFMIDEHSSVKASFTQNSQYVHLATLSPIALPTDIWVPCSDVVKPQLGQQYAAGYFRNFRKDMFETSVEVYYKHMDNQVEFAPGALPEDNINNNTDNNFVFGTGESYGAEFFFKKRTGKLNGWIGYTLSWTTRNFPDILDTDFYARYDRRHDGSLVVIYELSERWSFSSVFVYGTGNAITIPVERYVIEGNIINVYGDRNSYRMAAYHRLDLSATWKCKPRKKFNSSWNFAVYNAYNRKNPYFIYFANKGSIQEGNLTITAKQVSLFPILPSVTWNFKF
ncbi:MAG: TonB-dependent receptor plug [Bacteroidetes bacterium]|nr:MAG: TonB-dependent receptor plug [Bacteroidota bacterium]